jgi:hypothetical protein
MVLDGKASPRSIPWRRPPQNGDAWRLMHVFPPAFAPGALTVRVGMPPVLIFSRSSRAFDRVAVVVVLLGAHAGLGWITFGKATR